MNTGKMAALSRFGWVWLVALILLAVGAQAFAGTEDTFDVLRVGTQVYSNVTVTSKTKAYVFILHSTGMSNIRIADLPSDVLHKLGYTTPEEQKEAKRPTAWAKRTMAKLEGPQVKGLEQQVQAWEEKIRASNFQLSEMDTQFWMLLGGALLVLHLFFSYCCMLICQKTGARPSLLVFVPILQACPMFRAASMSPWWLLALFIPGLNLVAQILWCLKIVQARQKSGWVVLFLLLPPTTPLAFLYLAFSSAAPAPKKEPPRVQIMTLETA